MLTALLLGLVQGCTEFLPVSSTGHLALTARVFGLTEPFYVAVAGHAGTSMAATWAYRKDYLRVARRLRSEGNERRFAGSLVAAQAGTLAAAGPLALALALGDLTSWYSSPVVIGSLMLVNAAVLATTARQGSPDSAEGLPAVSWRAALAIGLCQGIAALPGLSRAGMTMAAGLWFGLSREDAANLSYLIAPPVMLASLAFWLPALAANIIRPSGGWQLAGVMLLVSGVVGVVGFLVLKGMVGWVRRGRLWWFSPWSAAVGLAALFGGLFQTG